MYDSLCDGSFFFIMQFHDKNVVSKLHSMASRRHDCKHILANNHAPVSSQGNQITFNCYQDLLYEASNFILDLREKLGIYVRQKRLPGTEDIAARAHSSETSETDVLCDKGIARDK